MSNKWTYKTALEWAIKEFQSNDIDTPHLEAEILLSNALNIERIKLYISPEKEIKEKDLDKFKDHISRRSNNEPTAYILGNQPFMSMNFKVTPNVLIPRPETEILVQAAIDMSKNFDNEVNILDIGTGSGVIAVSLAKLIPNAKVYATDDSGKALAVARENAKIHNVEHKITFEKADMYPSKKMQFDIIVANLPYIRSQEIERLHPEVKNHEPSRALDGGKDGLELYREMISRLNGFTKEFGYLIFEFGIDQDKELSKIIKETVKPFDMRIKKDLAGIERIVVAKLLAE